MMRHKYWRAVYENGTALCQREKILVDGQFEDVENKSDMIDHDRLIRFELLEKGKVVHTVDLNGGKKLVYFMRNTFDIAVGNKKIESVSETTTVHHIGYALGGSEYITKIKD